MRTLSVNHTTFRPLGLNVWAEMEYTQKHTHSTQYLWPDLYQHIEYAKRL